MPTDFTSNPETSPVGETESPMFAPIPSWERNRKRRGFGRATRTVVAPEKRTFAADDMDDGPALMTETIATRPVLTDPMLRDEPLMTPSGTAFAEPPAYVRTTIVRRNNAAPVAIAAGLIALGGLAAAGWYASRPHDAGIAQLTPGSTEIMPPAVTDTAVNPPAAVAANTEVSTPAAPAQTVAPVRRATTLAAAAPRARPAPTARSVEDAGVNTAATLPPAPQPYTGSAMAEPPATAAPEPVQITPPPVNPMPAPEISPTPSQP